MNSGACLLADRGVLRITGADATEFLNRLFTNSMLDMRAGEARYTGFLTPQGKVMFDFFVVALPEGAAAGYHIDCAAIQAADLAKRLNFQKLRARVVVEDRSGALAIAAAWGEQPPRIENGLVWRDPRDPRMGWRIVAPPDSLAAAIGPDETSYEAHRVACGVPKGGVDFTYGEAFAHDADLDYFHGVDFKKGCYVGQEIVARVHFRKTARKRIVQVRFDGPEPAPGTEVMAGEASIGRVGSVSGAAGLAMLRLDRLDEARAANIPLTAGGAVVDARVPQAFLEAAGPAKVAP